MPRDEESSYNYIDFAELARLLAQAAVATPAVVQAPANTAPSAPAVQQAVTQIAQAVVPVIAPKVPRQAILALAKEIADEVVTTPEIIKADTGVSVPPKVIDSIVSEVSDVIPQDVIDNIEKSLSNASAEQVVVPEAAAPIDLPVKQPIASSTKEEAARESGKFQLAGQTSSPANVENTSVSEADISKIMQDAANAAAEEVVVPEAPAEPKPSAPKDIATGTYLNPPAAAKTVSQMSQAEIDAATAKTVASGGKSTDEANRLPGETASQANARITAGYKDMLAEPILSEAAKKAGATVEFVRTEAGGVGSYTVVYPAGYTGPKETTTNWTAGIIPSNSPYVTGTTLGVMSDGNGKYTTVTGAPVSTKPTLVSNPPSGTQNPPAGTQNPPTPNPPTNTVNPPTPTPTPTLTPPPGTPPAFVYDDVSKTWVMPPYPKDGVKYTWDDAAGWVDVTVVPGSTGTSTTETRNLAPNTFKNTLSLMFGPNEANQPWMDELYKVVSGYYKTGSTIEEAIDLSLRDVRNNPNMKKFTQRFKAIFALEDMVRAGRPVYVPTVAEYVKTEEKLGDVMTRAGLQDIATSTELSDILATGKSVTEVTSIIQDVFNAIDTAPDAWKKQLSAKFPTATRTGLAKALLFGEKGAQQLEREVGATGVQAAASMQGLNVADTRATDLFAQGYTFETARPKFGQVASILPTATKLAQISNTPGTVTQTGVESAVFEQNAAQLKTLEDLAKQERARYSGKTGNIGSAAFASRERGLRL